MKLDPEHFRKVLEAIAADGPIGPPSGTWDQRSLMTVFAVAYLGVGNILDKFQPSETVIPRAIDILNCGGPVIEALCERLCRGVSGRSVERYANG